MVIRRDGKSDFVDSLIVGKRGTILKVAGTIKGPGIPDGTGPMRNTPGCPFSEEKQGDFGADTKPEAENVLNKFDKSQDIPDKYIKIFIKRLDDGDDPKTVMTDFFKGLQEAKKSKNKMTIRTAKLFRQSGIFKIAEVDVYQDLSSGEFWKICDDGKSVARMFKEIDGVTEGVN
jgi:hypothetical protein